MDNKIIKIIKTNETLKNDIRELYTELSEYDIIPLAINYDDKIANVDISLFLMPADFHFFVHLLHKKYKTIKINTHMINDESGYLIAKIDSFAIYTIINN